MIRDLLSDWNSDTRLKKYEETAVKKWTLESKQECSKDNHICSRNICMKGRLWGQHYKVDWWYQGQHSNGRIIRLNL